MTKWRLTLPTQWSITLLLGLFLGFTYQQPTVISLAPVAQSPALTVSLAPIAVASLTPVKFAITNEAIPYKTQPGGWLVRVKFFRNTVPQIEKVISLPQSRIAILPNGENRIEVLNNDGDMVFMQTFAIEFLAGDPPKPVDTQTVIFMIPPIDDAYEIVVFTVNGKANYVIPAK